MLFVFMSQPDYSCNPYSLYEYIKNNTNYEVAWILKKYQRYEAMVKRGIRCALYNTLEGNKLIGEADYVVMNSYTFPAIPKKEGQIFVNLWHGSGIKSHDFYNHDIRPQQAQSLRKFASITDLMCVQSLDDRFKLSAQLGLDMRKVYVTGQPRLDCVLSSDGKSKLRKIYGSKIDYVDRFIFFAPSFRANSSSHSGSLVSDNIFRLADYDSSKLNAFLEEHNTALIYKLHPIEQTAFKGRTFGNTERILELDEEMLFDADVRYDELLNAFDIMITDYSSIAYDFLMLDRPIIYLLPDYQEYTSERGFVFNHIDNYMPGEKVFSFADMLIALDEELCYPQKSHDIRKFVTSVRFDYGDGNSAKRCMDVLLKYKPPVDSIEIYSSDERLHMPSIAEQIMGVVGDKVKIIDSTHIFSESEKEKIRKSGNLMYYLETEIPLPYRQLSGQSSVEIADYEFYYELKEKSNISFIHVDGGVDYKMFSASMNLKHNHSKTRIGFAGTIDKRIYFAMVQYICESFPDAEVIFAGDIMGDYPVWLNGYDNLRYLEASYTELPRIISSFDVCILPFFGRHQEYVPSELFQYLAVGKQVVTSDMPNIPECAAVYRSISISQAAENISIALDKCNTQNIISDAQDLAKKYDWKIVAKQIFDIY